MSIKCVEQPRKWAVILICELIFIVYCIHGTHQFHRKQKWSLEKYSARVRFFQFILKNTN